MSFHLCRHLWPLLLSAVTFFAHPAWSQTPSCQIIFGATHSAVSSIDASQFDDVINQSRSRGFFTAKLGSANVFIKVPRSSSADIQEKEWLLKLNQINLGPKLLGVTEIGGREGLVMQAVEGANTQFPMIADAAILLKPKMVEEMWRQIRVLYENQIWPIDLQFIVNQKGDVVMIDPELFEDARTRPRGWNDYENTLNHILMLWQMDDRLIN